jgi:uncharacterized membrane protein
VLILENEKIIKIIANLSMLLFIIILYAKIVTSVELHEIIGILILIPFFIHIISNRKWMSDVSKKLSSTECKREKILYLLNMILIIVFIITIISGISISQFLFMNSLKPDPIWLNIHITSAIIALIIILIHSIVHIKLKKETKKNKQLKEK